MSARASYDRSWFASLGVPEHWLGAIVQPPPAPSVPDPDRLIEAALAQPIGSPRLAELVQPGRQVALIVDDATRKTPVARMLPRVLAELERGGVARQDVTIVIALGTHRPMRADELAAKLGPAAAGLRIVNQPCTAADAFVSVGDTAITAHAFPTLPPIPAQVNRCVLEADVRVALGMITPHLDAGFSGGSKMILPGVCSLATVDAFHRASAFVDANPPGNPETPLRRLLETFVAAHAPLHFIVNAVLAPDGSLAACVAGDAVAAHRAGVQVARRVFGAPAPRRYPVVAADCAPYDEDLWQSIKGAWAGDRLTADGGWLILLAAMPEGAGSYDRVPRYAGRNADELRAAILAGAVEDAMQAATGVMWAQLRRRVKLAFVSPGLDDAIVRQMGAHPFADGAAALHAALATLPAADRCGAVAVIPQAGVVLPMPESEQP